MHIAVILSMKRGLEHFVYRELSIMFDQGVKLHLFPTKQKIGVYNPKQNWNVTRWNPLQVIVSQPLYALKAPKKYFSLLRLAIRYRSILDFMIGWYFSSHMQEIDVIYSTFGDHKFFIGYYCKRILEKPLAVTIHAYELYKNPNPAFFEFALKDCNQVITVTEYNKEFLQTNYGLPPEKIRVIRISVDTEAYQPTKKFIVLMVAYFTERKGHEILFEALKEIALDDLEVWIVGDEGGEEATIVDVKSLAQKIGVENQVAFFGNLSGNALRGVYQVCDVFCLPCRHDRFGIAEGFPTVLAEAMAFGKPVITSRHVEIPRIIDEILVDENDVSGLANALRSAYQSKNSLQKMSSKNRQIAENLFSKRNALETLQTLKDITKIDT